MRLLRTLLVSVGLSLFAVSAWFELGLHARFLDWTEPPLSDRYPGKWIDRYETRKDAEAACGEDNVFQTEIVRRTGTLDGPFVCRSDLR